MNEEWVKKVKETLKGVKKKMKKEAERRSINRMNKKVNEIKISKWRRRNQTNEEEME